MAAENGQFDICQLIVEMVENKNPANTYGWTPVHDAARNGYFDICTHTLNIKQRNKDGKRCKMMPIYEERVYNPWPLDKEEAVANLVQK